MNKQMIEKREREIVEKKAHIAELQKELREIEEFWKTHDEEDEKCNVEKLYKDWRKECGVDGDYNWIKALAVLSKADENSKAYTAYKKAYDVYKKMNKGRVYWIKRCVEQHEKDLAVYEARLAVCK